MNTSTVTLFKNKVFLSVQVTNFSSLKLGLNTGHKQYKIQPNDRATISELINITFQGLLKIAQPDSEILKYVLANSFLSDAPAIRMYKDNTNSTNARIKSN